MIKKLDCKNLACPGPVLKTKEAWEELEDEGIIDIELNSLSSIENIKRFAKSQGIYFEVKSKTKELTVISLVKGYECKLEQKSDKKFYTIILSSVISAILASSCCLAPLLFLLFGVSVGSLTFLQTFAPYHIYFSIFATVLIVYLWYDYLKKKKNQLFCATALCKNYKLYLIVGSLFVGFFTTYPYWIGYILE
jgi:TusA-related sulfurtransferase